MTRSGPSLRQSCAGGGAFRFGQRYRNVSRLCWKLRKQRHAGGREVVLHGTIELELGALVRVGDEARHEEMAPWLWRLIHWLFSERNLAVPAAFDVLQFAIGNLGLQPGQFTGKYSSVDREALSHV